MLKKLVKGRRTVASIITPNEERVDPIEEKRENTKCNFQIEQQTKVKDKEEKYQESYTNVERTKTKQDRNIEESIAEASQNIEGNIAQGN